MMVTHPQSQGAAVDTLTPRKSGDNSNFIKYPETWRRDTAPVKDLIRLEKYIIRGGQTPFGCQGGPNVCVEASYESALLPKRIR
jgi:hypothetical protein